MLPIKKRVLIFEVLKLGLLLVLVGSLLSRRLNPLVAGLVLGKAGLVLGIAGLLYGAYTFYRALCQKEHSNVLLRLRGDDRKIPTTKWHRAMNVILATGMIACGFGLLLLRW
jgi:hypothetical protein